MSHVKMLLIGLCIAAAAGGCSSTFSIAKEGGRSYFFGSRDQGFYTMMCESGDLTRILNDTSLQVEIKNALYKGNCSADRSSEKVKEIYASLTAEQRKELRLAFKKHGYEVNYMMC